MTYWNSMGVKKLFFIYKAFFGHFNHIHWSMLSTLYNLFQAQTSPSLAIKFWGDKGRNGQGGKHEPIINNYSFRPLVIIPSSHMKRVEHIWQGLRKLSPICQQNSDASEDAQKWFPDSQNDSFPNMYDILEAKVDRLVGKSILAKKTPKTALSRRQKSLWGDGISLLK